MSAEPGTHADSQQACRWIAATACTDDDVAHMRRRFKHQGSKEKAIIAAGFTPIAYYQRLNVMLDDERVRAAAPQIIDVLRARRDAD